MTQFNDNKNFYPTPERLTRHLLTKLKKKTYEYRNILEPSFGKGDILKVLNERFCHYSVDFYGIEKDTRLFNMVKGDQDLKVKLLDRDFLLYEGNQQFDLIVANFPFSDGEKHVSKALDIVFNGEIICIVNAETVRNPNTALKKQLVERLKKLNADIEYRSEAFSGADSERKTEVEIAIIHIEVKNEIENNYSDGLKRDTESKIKVEQKNELVSSNDFTALVEEFNDTKRVGIETILEFYRNYNKIGNLLSISPITQYSDDKDEFSSKDNDTLTNIAQNKVNNFIITLKKKYWRKALELKDIRRKLSSKRIKEIECDIDKYLYMEFSLENLRQFQVNIVEDLPKMIETSVVELFDEFTKWACDDYSGNKLHFDSWMTNESYKVNKKVIIPFYQNNYSWESNLSVSHSQKDMLHDIDVVFNYFVGLPITQYSGEICSESLKEGKNRKIETDLFIISIFKKGTMHIEFKDKDALRWFNIMACKGKNWLPDNYGERTWEDMSNEEKTTVKGFEGQKSYVPAKGNNGIKLNFKEQLLLAC